MGAGGAGGGHPDGEACGEERVEHPHFEDRVAGLVDACGGVVEHATPHPQDQVQCGLSSDIVICEGAHVSSCLPAKVRRC